MQSLDNQRMMHLGHSGVWKKFQVEWALNLHLLRTQVLIICDNTGHGQNSYTAAREAAAVVNQEELDRRTHADEIKEAYSSYRVNIQEALKAGRRRQEARLARTQFKRNEAIKREKEVQLTVALKIGKLHRHIGQHHYSRKKTQKKRRNRSGFFCGVPANFY